MDTVAAVDISLDKFLDAENISRDIVAEIKKQVYSFKEVREDFDRKIEELKVDIKKERDSNKSKDLIFLLGICEWIIGRVKEASELLKEVKSRKIAAYYLGKCYQEMNNYDEALELFDRAMKTDTEEFDISMDIVETKRMSGNIEGALQIIKKFSQSHRNNAELYYQWGRCLDDLGAYQEAFCNYEQALQVDPNNFKTIFRMAFNYDMYGNDEKAIEYYEKCTNISPTYKNVFINLGILYEDIGRYEDALYCFEAVLDVEPTNERALLFAKDVKASLNMYYDDEISKKQGKEYEMLNIPISDFELSVRSKNCLEKMRIRTLRDLTKVTEAELLSFKNFGETSLNEIKSILAQKGLRLGQALESDVDAGLFPRKTLVKKQDTATITDISDLLLSTRSRNALDKIGIKTIEELTDKTEAELVKEDVKQNYIDEIKNCLSKFELYLKDDDEGYEEDLGDNITDQIV